MTWRSKLYVFFLCLSISIPCIHTAFRGGLVHPKRRIPNRSSVIDRCCGISKRLCQWKNDAQGVQLLVDNAIQAKKAKKRSQPIMRVLLDEKKKDRRSEWRLFSPLGFVVYDPSNLHKRRCIKQPEILITYKAGYFCVNGRLFHAKNVEVSSLQGCITYDTRVYEGDLLFTTLKNRLLCVNNISLESYVCSVVHTESWPGWPLEVNKAFAIMARSYAMAQAHASRKSKLPYHIKNSNAHQTYKGVHAVHVIHQAVEQTKGVVLTYHNKPILAMFDCCCGGVIPMHIQDYLDFRKVPYLARSYACEYCKNCKIYAWQVEYDISAFERHICSELRALARLHDAKVIRKDKAGLALEIAIKGSKSIHTMSGRRLYSLLSEVKSFCFDIVCTNKKIVVSGRGYGHHCGLCQWGAREMVRLGFTYKQILSFYYPHTTLIRMA